MAEGITNLSAGNFDDFVKTGKVVVDFWAPWCGPCKMLGPIFEEAAGKAKNAKFGKVNIDENQDLAQKFGVMSIPTMIFFKDGEMVDRSVGLLNKEDILEKVGSSD